MKTIEVTKNVFVSWGVGFLWVTFLFLTVGLVSKICLLTYLSPLLFLISMYFLYKSIKLGKEQDKYNESTKEHPGNE